MLIANAAPNGWRLGTRAAMSAVSAYLGISQETGMSRDQGDERMHMIKLMTGEQRKAAVLPPRAFLWIL